MSLANWVPIVGLFALGTLFALFSVVIAPIVGPHKKNAAKHAAYECGIEPTPQPLGGGQRFPIKFYLTAMLFIVFDIEIVFLYPFSTVMRGLGGYGLVMLAVFVLVLLVPFAYLLSVGALAWGPVQQVVRQIAPVMRTKHAVLDPGGPKGEAA